MCSYNQTCNIITGCYICKTDTIFFTVTCLKDWIWKFWVWSPVISMCWFLFINETFTSVEDKTLRIQQLFDSEIQGIWNAAVSWGEHLPMFQGITVPSSLVPRWQWRHHDSYNIKHNMLNNTGSHPVSPEPLATLLWEAQILQYQPFPHKCTVNIKL